MIPHDKFIDKIKQYIDEKKLFSFGDHVIIGLSGGADSVCLLLVLKRLQQVYNLSITAIHVHHGIRGESAEHDLKFSRQLCEKEEIEFVEKRCDVPALAAKHHLTEEEAGRRVRYETFEYEAKKRGASVIAVAHHMDDQAETVLMNLLRGSGIRGCSGIPCKRSLSDKGDIVVVRPLLGMRREEIEAWLIESGQEWCIDETNLTDDYLRSRIRNRLLPLLSSEYNAQAAEHIACAAGDFSEAEEYLRDQAQALFSSWNCVLHKQMMLPVKELKLQKPILQRYLIQEAISHTGGVKDITRTHIESVIGLLSKRTGSMVNLPQRRKARIQYEFLIIEKESFFQSFPAVRKLLLQKCIGKVRGGQKDLTSAHLQSVSELFDRQVGKQIDLPGGVAAKRTYDGIEIIRQTQSRAETGKAAPESDAAGKLELRFVENGDILQAEEIPQKSYTKWIDYDIIKCGLCVRTRQSGDYLVIDDQGRRQKLKAWFINEKIPKEERDRMLLVADGSHIVWIPGYRMSRAYKVTEKTKNIVEIKITEEEKDGRNDQRDDFGRES